MPATVGRDGRTYGDGVWECFDKLDEKNAECKICKKAYSYASTSTNLKTHLRIRHKDVYDRCIGKSTEDLNPDKSVDDVAKTLKYGNVSDTWECFDKLDNEIAVCKICKQACPYGSTTTTLEEHLELLHRDGYDNRIIQHQENDTTDDLTRHRIANRLTFRNTIMWVYFDKLKNEHGKCKICKKTFSYSSNSSNLKKHLQREHSDAYEAWMNAVQEIRQTDESTNLADTLNRSCMPVVWEYFDKLDRKNAECKLCKKVYSFASTSTNLKTHLRIRHKDEYDCGVSKLQENQIPVESSCETDKPCRQVPGIWNHFDKLDNKHAECKVCKKAYAYSTTNNLKKHLQKVHNDVNASGISDPQETQYRDELTCDTVEGPPKCSSEPDIWKYFDKLGNKNAKCKHCKKAYSYSSTSTNLKTHLRIRHKDVYDRCVDDPIETQYPVEFTGEAMVEPAKQNSEPHIWKYFDKLGNKNAECKLCKKAYSYASTSTNLKTHLRFRHKDVYNLYVNKLQENQNPDESIDDVAKTLKCGSVSNIWDHFDKIDHKHAECKICKKIYSYSSTTNNLKKHLVKVHKDVNASCINEPQETKDPDELTSEPVAELPKRSLPDIWEYFDKLDKKDAECKLCKKVYSYASTSTNLKTHLRLRHKDSYDSWMKVLQDSHNPTHNCDIINIWEHFDKLLNKIAQCNICHKSYSYSSTTNNLKKHLLKSHKDEYESWINESQENQNPDELSCDSEGKLLISTDDVIWEYFDIVGNKQAVCKICKQTYSYASSIDSLRGHLRELHKDFWINEIQDTQNESACSEQLLLNSVSDIWKYFDIMENKQAKCKICQKIYSYESSSGNLIAHLRKRHISELGEKQNEEDGTSSSDREDLNEEYVAPPLSEEIKEDIIDQADRRSLQEQQEGFDIKEESYEAVVTRRDTMSQECTAYSDTKVQCRVCLTVCVSTDCTPLCVLEPSVGRKYAAMLRDVTRVRAGKNDVLCERCRYKTLDLYKFWLQARQADAQLTARTSSLCSNVSDGKMDDTLLSTECVENELEHGDDTEYKEVPLENSPPTRVSNEQSDTFISVSPDKEPQSYSEIAFKCSTCYETFPDTLALLRHVRSNHIGSNRSVTSVDLDVKPVQAKVRCGVCGLYDTEEKLDAHCKEHGSTAVFTCALCSRVYLKYSQFKRHFHTHHNELTDIVNAETTVTISELGDTKAAKQISEYMHTSSIGHLIGTKIESQEQQQPEEIEAYIQVCGLCGAVILSPALLKEHNKTDHPDFHLRCYICARLSKCKRRRLIHMQECKLKKHPYECVLCGSKFNNKSNHEKHLEIVHKKPHYMCEHCDYTSQKRLTSKMHAFYCGPLEECICDICNKKFDRKGKLRRHILTHRRGKILCDTCGLSFRTRYHLRRHQRVHTGERPYRCHLCGKGFATNCMMRYHIMYHKGDTPYKCDVCYKKFVRPCSYRRHRMIHTGERPYRCDICNSAFVQKGCLKKHMKKHLKSLTLDPEPFKNMCSSGKCMDVSELCHELAMSEMVGEDTRYQQPDNNSKRAKDEDCPRSVGDTGRKKVKHADKYLD